MDGYVPGETSYKAEESKKVFNPRIEMFSAFNEPFSTPSSEVVGSGLESAAACCACTACTACR